MTRVRIEGLTKVFGKTLAVDNLSLEVRDKEFVSLLGPSGCGKTTTLNCISGLETPTKGDIYFDDQRINDMPPKDRGIGLVFQSYAIFGYMTVFENLAFGLRIRRVPEDEIKHEVEQMAEFLGIREVLQEKAGKQSLTNLQKTAIGRTLLIKPKVLLLDEPLSNLDADARDVMRAELKRLQRDVEQTTIFVTHDQLEAIALSDKVAIMNLGRLQQYDTPDVVYNHPKNQFVANFVGSPSMNIIDCSLKLDNEQAVLVHPSFTLDVTNMRHHLEKITTGSEVVVGIRPEYLTVTKQPSKLSVAATVYVTEPLGHENIVYLQLDGILLRAVTPAAVNFNINEKVGVEFHKDKIHIFDRKDGEAIV